MEIKGVENMTYGELYDDIDKGGKFVIFTYVISIVVMTFKRPSNTIYYVRSNESAISYGWPYLLITMLFGWWGIPFGPIYSIGSIVRSFNGDDVTDDVMKTLNSENN